MSGYRLYLEPCGSDLDCIVQLSGSDNISYDYPPSICDGREYSFFVQSINQCGGGGPNSSMVMHTCGECVVCKWVDCVCYTVIFVQN